MRKLQPKTPGQKSYLQAIKNNKVIFCSGVAGTGKTAIATRYGAIRLLDSYVQRIIITRPLVQAGEDTGFLPGNIDDKMDPYLRPIYDELKPYMDCKQIKRYMEERLIEIVPFAYMRGRNFHNAFIIADECQNATHEQLRMLLTRIGRDSQMVINGDPTQCDLPKYQKGALEEYANKLCHIDGVAYITLCSNDIIREPIVADILNVLDG